MQKRGANIYAEFLGGSFTCDAYHMTEPRPDGNIALSKVPRIFHTKNLSVGMKFKDTLKDLDSLFHFDPPYDYVINCEPATVLVVIMNPCLLGS